MCAQKQFVLVPNSVHQLFCFFTLTFHSQSHSIFSFQVYFLVHLHENLGSFTSRCSCIILLFVLCNRVPASSFLPPSSSLFLLCTSLYSWFSCFYTYLVVLAKKYCSSPSSSTSSSSSSCNFLNYWLFHCLTQILCVPQWQPLFSSSSICPSTCPLIYRSSHSIAQSPIQRSVHSPISPPIHPFICPSIRPQISPLKTKRRPLCLKTHFVPRSKHLLSRL